MINEIILFKKLNLPGEIVVVVVLNCKIYSVDYSQAVLQGFCSLTGISYFKKHWFKKIDILSPLY